MNTLEILTKGLELIRDPKHWTKNVLAKDSENRDVDPMAPSAVCWCSIGALVKAEGNGMQGEAYHEALCALEAAEGAAGFYREWVSVFNDTHTHTEVVKVWEKAIEHARNTHPGS